MSNHDQDEYDNFRLAVTAGSDLTRARWDAVCDKVIGDALTRFGAAITREDVLQLPSARLATLTSEPLSDVWADEALKIAKVSTALEAKKNKDRLESGDIPNEFAGLTREQRMTKSRQLCLSVTPNQKQQSTESESVLIARLLTLSPIQRLAKAREWGLTG